MKLICLAWAVFIPLFAFSQKQGNVWCFGNQAGLNFNGGAPLTFTGSKTGTSLSPGQNQEGTSCISDSSGALLFYTNGQTIWNRFHQVMLNGNGIMGGVSSTQAALIVPQPGNDTLFYVFTSDEFQSYPNALKGYRYSVVNMCLDSAKGAVVAGQKNIFLADSATEKLSACLDALGTGYWVLGHKMYSNQFHAWHLSSVGINSTVVTGIGKVHGFWPNLGPNSWFAPTAQGQMKFNPTGTRIGLVHGNYQPAMLELFDFNNSSGTVSNPCQILPDSAMLKSSYGLEFSHDGSKVYIALGGGLGGNRLHQYDLNAGNCSAVKASDLLIYQSSVNPPMIGMQLATDNRIYIVRGPNLASINAPTLPGAASNFTPIAVGGATFNNTFSLPSFIAGFAYTNRLNPCADNLSANSSSSVICAGEQATLTVTGATSYTWSNGVNGPSITVNPGATTSYTVKGYGNGIQNLSLVITQSVVACAGIRQFAEADPLIRIFPNPSQGHMQLESEVNMDLIEVNDQFGRLIYQSRPRELQHSLKISGPGIFILKVQSGGQTLRKKLLIEKE